MCSSTTGAPAWAAAAICAGSGSMNSDTRMPDSASRPTASVTAASAPATSRPPSVVSSVRFSGTRQTSLGLTAQAISSISAVIAHSRFMRVRSGGRSA